MPIDDPQTWAQGAAALKSMFEGFRAALGMVRDVRDLRGSDPEKAKAIEAALEAAERGAKTAEAEIAKALGYELCKCEFPPNMMLTVGSHYGRGRQGPVFECPKCGYNTAMPYGFNRIARLSGGSIKAPAVTPADES
jgi:hypothetical protein